MRIWGRSKGRETVIRGRGMMGLGRREMRARCTLDTTQSRSEDARYSDERETYP